MKWRNYLDARHQFASKIVWPLFRDYEISDGEDAAYHLLTDDRVMAEYNPDYSLLTYESDDFIEFYDEVIKDYGLVKPWEYYSYEEKLSELKIIEESFDYFEGYPDIDSMIDAVMTSIENQPEFYPEITNSNISEFENDLRNYLSNLY